MAEKKTVTVGAKRLLDTALECRRIDEALVLKMVEEKKARPPKDAKRVLRFIASTEKVDRDGDILLQNWVLDGFKSNPIILWNHDQDKPIGRAIREEIVDDENDEDFKRVGKHLAIWVEFMGPEHGPHVEPLWLGFSDGFLKGGSVGYVPLELDEVYDEEKRKQLGLGPVGVLFKKCELAEFTLCTVPANRDALQVQMKSWPEPVRKSLEPLLLAVEKAADKVAKACGCGKPEGCGDPKSLTAAGTGTKTPAAPAPETKAQSGNVTFTATNEEGLDDLEDDVVDLCSDLESFADAEVDGGDVTVTFDGDTAVADARELHDRLTQGDLAGYSVSNVTGGGGDVDEAGAAPEEKGDDETGEEQSEDVTGEVAECVESLEGMVDELTGVAGAEEIAARMAEEIENIEELLGIDGSSDEAESPDQNEPTSDGGDEPPARPPLESNSVESARKSKPGLYASLLEDVARNLKA